MVHRQPFKCERLAGLLFITATGATIVSQILVAPIVQASDILRAVSEASGIFVTGVLLEAVNALASAGIAVALYPVMRRCNETAAAGYLSVRAIEGATGILAATALLGLLSAPTTGFFLPMHDLAFLMVLIVFSISTLILYPTLFRFRLVPAWISIWGLVGGILLLGSCLMIAFGLHDLGSPADMILSLPIAINEMVLALWLIFRGVSVEAART